LAGTANSAATGTSLSISDSTALDTGLQVLAATSGTGVAAASPRGSGLLGVSGSTNPAPDAVADVGVVGRADHAEAVAGVLGDSQTGAGVIGTAAGIGVLGGGGVVGLMGNTFDLTGTSVYAVSSGFPLPAPLANTALHARRKISDGGFAAYIDGRLSLRLSGRVAMARRTSVKVVAVPGLTPTMMAFAVLQSRKPGTWVSAAVPRAGSLAIYLNRPLASTAVVAWMVIG